MLAARDALRRRYASSDLRFTLDGNLVGDIGEAVAAELFGLELTVRCGAGIDGMSPGPASRSVQVKASGTFRGPAFRKIDLRADHLSSFTSILTGGSARPFSTGRSPSRLSEHRIAGWVSLTFPLVACGKPMRGCRTTRGYTASGRGLCERTMSEQGRLRFLGGAGDPRSMAAPRTSAFRG